MKHLFPLYYSGRAYWYKFVFMFLGLPVLGLSQTPAGFTQVAYEGFDYSSGSSLLNANGGSGWTTAWLKNYQDRFLKTGTSGFLYTGLNATGLRADYDSNCSGTCNQIAALKRTFSLNDDGVVYLQFITVLEATGGFGTPTIRMFNGSTQSFGIGANSGSYLQLLDSGLNALVTTTAPLSNQNFVILRVDYTNNKTEMWVNPTLSTFDYSNPTSPDASVSDFAPLFDQMQIFIRSGSIDEISVFYKAPATTAPVTFSGTTSICEGDSTTLTASGGISNTGDLEIWYDQANVEAFSEGWDMQLYTLESTTLNSNSSGILNVTSTASDPMIYMYNLGSFDPSVYTHINFRYRVTSGTASAAQIFFLNGSMIDASDTKYQDVDLISDNAWHIATLDMSTHALWTSDGNITGWRYDFATASGVTMDIDFIALATGPIIGTGSSVTVSPGSTTTYYVNRKGPEANTSYASQAVTVNPIPTPSFTAEPGTYAALNTDLTYTTESGQTNYVWTIPGTVNTDYFITSGGTSSDNSVTLKWLTSGSKTVSVSYTNLGGCSAVSPSSSTINVENPLPTYGAFETISRPYFSGTYTITPPTTNNTSPFVYASDNTAIATISGDLITFTGIGTATITASQVADANYNSGSVSTTLTVVGKNVASRFGGVSQTDGGYVSANGKVGGAFGVNKYGKRENVMDAIVTSGLVLYLDAGNPSSYPGSSTTWSDLSGNGNDGVLNGGVTYSASDGGALVFDGVNDSFGTDANIDLTATDEITIQVLVKTSTTGTHLIAEHSMDWNSNNAFGLAIEDSKVLFTDHNQGYNAMNSVASINDNGWHLLTGTIDRSMGSANQNVAYIDGASPNNTPKPSLSNDNSGNYQSHKFYVGSRAGSSYFFDGIIAKVLLYDRALTAEEIQQNFESIRTDYGL